MNIRTGIATTGALVALTAGAWLGHAHLSADPAATPTPQASATPDPLGPSPAWRLATPAERAEATRLMTAAAETCPRDIQHAYLGLAEDQAGEHEDLRSAIHPGQHYRFAPQAPGICD